MQLKNNDKRNTFEKGKTDLFKIVANYVGPIKKVRVEHDNSGRAPGCIWLLN
jgi:lipoxygenase homology domain-containing protein 1